MKTIDLDDSELEMLAESLHSYMVELAAINKADGTSTQESIDKAQALHRKLLAALTKTPGTAGDC